MQVSVSQSVTCKRSWSPPALAEPQTRHRRRPRSRRRRRSAGQVSSRATLCIASRPRNAERQTEDFGMRFMTPRAINRILFFISLPRSISAPRRRIHTPTGRQGRSIQELVCAREHAWCTQGWQAPSTHVLELLLRRRRRLRAVAGVVKGPRDMGGTRGR